MNIQKLIDQGEQAFKKRNYDYAITLLLEAVNFGPNNRKARELLRKSELKKYETSYPNAAMVAIFGLPKRVGMFFSGLGKGSNPEAYMMACERFLTIDPKNKGVNMALGDSAAHAGHIQSAIVAYETAAEHHPEDVTALKKLGALLVRNGEIQRAHKVYSRAVELDPKDQEAVKARKNVAAEASLKETGFETAGSSRDLIRNKDEATELERGERIHQTEDDLTVQRREVEQQLAGDPDNIELLQDLAEIAQKQKDWDVGIQALEKAHAAKPDNTVVHFALNEAKIVKLEQSIYEANRDGDKAKAASFEQDLDQLRIEHLQAKVKAYPTDLNIRFDLGEVLLKSGAFEDAIAQFQQTVRDPKYKNDSQLRLGQAFAAGARFDLAVRQLEQALVGHSAINDRVKEILYALGDIHVQTGDVAKAKENFGKIYEVDIGYLDVGDRLSKLDSSAEEGKLSLD
ncbi:MAG: tetratricopeptide repeat protein [Planctomycetota bacterium]|jgi:tetratricopeptide (TPR) repeat protein